MSLARLLACLLVPALLFAAPAIGAAPDPIEGMLAEADKARSSNPKRFAELLAALDASRHRATLLQQQRLRYLHAYSMLAYEDNPSVATSLAKALFKETSDVDLKFRAGALVANSGAITRNFSEGLRYLEQSLALRGQVADRDVRHDGINAAAIIYNQLGQYRLGLQYAEETLADKPRPRARCFAAHLRLEAQYYLKVPPDEASIIAIVEQCAAQGEAIVANLVRSTLARHWADQGQRNRAMRLLQEHLAEVEATRYPRLIAEFRSLLAEFSLAEGHAAAAETHAQATLAQSASLSSSLPLVTAYRTLYQLAERDGDPVAMLEQYRRYAQAEKAYLTDAQARELAYQIVRHESLQKSQQIELLERQNEVLQLQQRVDRQAAQNSRLLTMLLLVLASLVGYWAYQIKRRHSTLRHQAETDALTGVSNRHHFTIEGARSLAQCAQAGEGAALIMFDLDHFKSINDNYGHITGDWVLKRVADTCKAFCRRIDHLGRLGGEEFAILVQGFDASGAGRLAEDCRMRIAAIDTSETGYTFAVTGSFGVSTTVLSGYDLSRLLAHADQMLYRAKREGRNRVCIYTGETPAPFVASGNAAPVEALADGWHEALPSRTRTP
jgi:diguanylate cyclase (GGDEF)-like protein